MMANARLKLHRRLMAALDADGDVALAWICAGLGAYVDTGLLFNTDYRIVFRYMPTLGPYSLDEAKAMDGTLELFTSIVWGSRDDTGGTADVRTYHNVRVGMCQTNVADNASSKTVCAVTFRGPSAGATLGDDITIDYDGAKKATSFACPTRSYSRVRDEYPSSRWAEAKWPIYLFCYNVAGVPTFNAYENASRGCARIHYWRCYGADGAAIADYRPVLHDGDPCFKDLVTGAYKGLTVPNGAYVSYGYE